MKQELEFKMIVTRKHFLSNQNYFLTLSDRHLIISKDQNFKLNKYELTLNLSTIINWVLYERQQQSQIQSFGFQYKNKMKYFNGNAHDLLQLKKKIGTKMMFQIKESHYKTIQQIGKGISSFVHKVENQIDGKFYAAKSVFKNYFEDYEQAQIIQQSFFNEISIMGSLQHPYILTLHEVYNRPDSYLIIMELIEGSSLEDFFTKQFDQKFTTSDIQQILQQLLEALQYIHENNVVHRNLKPSNIFITKQNILKITDFGLAITIDNLKKSQQQCGTPGYVAPEILNRQQDDPPYLEKCDIFSVGVILYKLYFLVYEFIYDFSFTLRDLFSAENFEQIMHLNKLCNINLKLLKTSDIPITGIHLIRKMLAKDPNERISAKEALSHSFFKEQKLQSGSNSSFKQQYLISPLVEDEKVQVQLPSLICKPSHYEGNTNNRIPKFYSQRFLQNDDI